MKNIKIKTGLGNIKFFSLENVFTYCKGLEEN